MASMIARQHEFTRAQPGTDARRRPARHRQPDAGHAQPQPLPLGGHGLPVPPPGRWPRGLAVGKTLSVVDIDRVTECLTGHADGTGGFSGRARPCWTARSARGEESAGACSCGRRDAVGVDGTDKDGIILAAASEITDVTGAVPRPLQRVRRAHRTLRVTGSDARIDTPATREQKAKLARLPRTDHGQRTGGRERSSPRLTTGPGYRRAADRALKVVAASGWFAPGPSGTD